ncbi:hypothetical protein [Streptomyces sp. SAJ15]|uniref:hypothetical protein n=1 Tax=Streptomyces sp. SAJ15 TaxID=2011095 RepID=UPI0021B30D84|nr:hypothetical protein [Streptomyces sp. SAJ15]
MATLGIHKDFLLEFAKLEKPVQKRMYEVFDKFREHRHAGLHLEKLERPRDPRIRAIRITKFMQGVVLAPETGDSYLLLKVMPHDDAIDWALSHRPRSTRRLRASNCATTSRWNRQPHTCGGPYPQRTHASSPTWPARAAARPGAGRARRRDGAVVALHRALHLARRLPTDAPDGAILLTTYTRDLAADLRRDLELLIPDEALAAKIRVVNVDALANQTVREEHGSQLTILTGQKEIHSRWNRIARHLGVEFTDAFLDQEWRVCSAPRARAGTASASARCTG